jgi:hypothetical protein
MTQRKALAIFAVLVVVVFSGAIDRLEDVLFFPWALAEPPLLDHWTGTLTAGNGVRMAIALDLHRADRECDSGRCTQIEGMGTTCDARGTVLRYRVWGTPDDRHGRRMRLGAKPDLEPPPDGLELDAVGGSWDGGDRLDFQAGFFWRQGKSAISSTDDPATQPVPVRLDRKDEAAFKALCAGLIRSQA